MEGWLWGRPQWQHTGTGSSEIFNAPNKSGKLAANSVGQIVPIGALRPEQSAFFKGGTLLASSL